MSIEKMREEFEAWICSEFAPYGGVSLANIQGGYCDALVQASWSAWKASRDALVVELPGSRSLSASDDPWSVRDWCKDAIESAGVRVKE